MVHHSEHSEAQRTRRERGCGAAGDLSSDRENSAAREDQVAGPVVFAVPRCVRCDEPL